MGAGYEVACITCKKQYYLGYGSYRSFAPAASKWWDAEFAPEHEGHELLKFNEDWTSVNSKTGNLENDYDGTVLIEGFKNYEIAFQNKHGGVPGKYWQKDEDK